MSAIVPIMDFRWSAMLARAHASEWANDWQYGSVWRFVPRGIDDAQDFEPLGPPEGEGWELNVDRAPDGREVRSPAQQDVLMQVTYWRRPSPGMMSWHTQHKVSRRLE